MLRRLPARSRAVARAAGILPWALATLVLCSAGPAAAEAPEVAIGPLLDVHIGPRDQAEPAVAADTVNGGFLTVWNHWADDSTDADIHGQLVGVDGAPFGPLIPVSAVAGSRQRIPSGARKVVAFDPANERFLVVWQDGRNDTPGVFGQLVHNAATMPTMLVGIPYAPLFGANFAISPQPPIAHQATSPAVALDSVNGRFLVVWAGSADTTPVNVYGQFIEPDGSAHGRTVQITSFAGDQQVIQPDLAFDPANERFLVTWGEAEGGRVAGRFVNADGTLAGPAFAIGSFDRGAFRGWLTFDPVHTRFLQIWNGRSGQLVYADGRLIGGEIPLPAPLAESASAVFWPAANRFLLVGNVDAHYVGVGGQLLDPDGTPSGPHIPIFEVDFRDPFRDAYMDSYPATVAAGPGHTGALVVWDDVPRTVSGMDIFGKLLTVEALETVHVDDSNVTGRENGSPEWPFNTIQEGIHAAADGGLIKVAQGFYREDLSIAGKSVTILGGYFGGFYPGVGDFVDGRRNPDPAGNHTLVLGRAGPPQIACEGDAARGSVVSGFTILGGGANVRGGVVLQRVIAD